MRLSNIVDRADLRFHIFRYVVVEDVAAEIILYCLHGICSLTLRIC